MQVIQHLESLFNSKLTVPLQNFLENFLGIQQ